jgi:hypothetical protein
VRFAPVALVAVLAARASAHIVPIVPSTCGFDPASVELPATAVVAPLAPAGGDEVDIIYDLPTSTAQFSRRSVPPRPFSVGGVDGTLALPPFFVATLLANGELTTSPEFTFTLGADTVTVSIPLTTGLVVAGDSLIEGAPIGPDGRFTWVGVVDPSPLGPPLAGGPLAVRLSCQATPVPDTDQFRVGTTTPLLSVSLKASLLKLKLVATPGTGDEPDFAGPATLLRVSSGGAPVASLALAGLQARGRKNFVGQSGDGRATIGVRKIRRKGEVAYRLVLKLQGPSMPSAVDAPLVATITYDVGGLLSGKTVTLRPKRHGTLLRYP